MRYELTRSAERDIRDILTETYKTFGPVQLEVYAGIIEKGLEMVGDDALRGGSVDRSEIAAGVRLFHLELAVGRRGGAVHCLYYVAGTLPSGSPGTIILRVLHERMEPRYRIVRSLESYCRSKAT